MSRLYMKQKVFSLVDRFTVKDEEGQDRYFVEGQFSLGKKLHIYDAAGEEVALVREKLFNLLPRFQVFVRGIQTAEIRREFTLLRPRYTIDGLDWECAGDFLNHEYSVTCGQVPIVMIRKQWLAWGDTYELDVADPRNEIQALAVVLAIDVANARAAAASSAPSSSN